MLERCQSELKALQEERAAEAKNSIDSTVQQLTKQLQAHESELSRARQDLRSVEEGKMKAESDLRFERAQRDSLHQGLEDLNQRFQKSVQEAETLRSDLKKTKNENSALKTQLENALSNVEQAQASRSLEQENKSGEQHLQQALANLRIFHSEEELRRVKQESEQTHKREIDTLQNDYNRRLREAADEKECEKESISENQPAEDYENRLKELENRLRQAEARSRQPEDRQQPDLRTRQQLEAQIRQQLEADLRQELEAQIRPQLETQIRPQLEAQIRPQLEVQIRPQLEAQIRPQLEAQIRQQLEGQIRQQLEAQSRNQLETQSRQQQEAAEKEVQRVRAEYEKQLSALRKQQQEPVAPVQASDSAKDTEIAELRADVNELLLALDEAHREIAPEDMAERVQELSQMLAQRDKIIKDLNTLRTAGAEGSPEALLHLRLSELQEQLDASESSRKLESDCLVQRCEKVERQAASNDAARKRAEVELERLRYENKQLKEALVWGADPGSAQMSDRQRKQEFIDLQMKLKVLQDEKANIEQRFAEFKMESARKEIERENQQSRTAGSERELKDLKQKHTVLEAEFFKVTQQLGETLNHMNELEQENQYLRQLSSPKNANSRKK